MKVAIIKMSNTYSLLVTLNHLHQVSENRLFPGCGSQLCCFISMHGLNTWSQTVCRSHLYSVLF